MARRRKRESVIGDEMLDELAQSIKTEDDFNAVMRQLSKGLLERVLEAEMTEHLGHESGGVVVNTEGNTRDVVSIRSLQRFCIQSFQFFKPERKTERRRRDKRR